MPELTMNRKLNLVIPVDVREGLTVYVHSTPISREVFETYYQVIARTFTGMYNSGLLAAPRTTSLELRRNAMELKMWEGRGGVETGLLGEIHRLTNVMKPNKSGWEIVPYEDVIRDKFLDEDDVSDIENAICFFIVASAMHRRAELGSVMEIAQKFWGVQLTLLTCTDYRGSLSTPTSDESTGEKARASRIPA